MTIEYHAIEFETAHEAIQWTEASGKGVAILLDGPKVVEQQDVDRLAAAGVEFAYLPLTCRERSAFADAKHRGDDVALHVKGLHDHEMPDGTHRIVTVPVN